MSELATHRPTTMDEVIDRHRRIFSPAALLRAIRFKPEATDVFVAPFAKCGTTWLQQIVHSLRSRGDLDFDDISRVVPWLEVSTALGIDLNAPQKANPRAFKSHLPWKLIPKGARYVVALRDPRDAMVSGYRFFEGWFFEAGSVSMEEWAHRWYMQRKSGTDYWSHLLSWWAQQDRPDVLVLAYEHLIEDPVAGIKTIADFLDIQLDDELFEIVIDQSSLATMKKNKNRYDDLLLREAATNIGNVPPGESITKVRKGKVGSFKTELAPDLVRELDEIWRDTVTKETGADSYEELIARL